MSVLACAYEAYMSLVWEPRVVAPIRLDILFLLPLLALVDLLAGLYCLRKACMAGRASPLWAAALLLLAVPLLAGLGWALSDRQMRADSRAFEQGRRARFEARFRDESTERRFFGELASDSAPWAGYYRGEGEDDRFQHLVINSEGRFWLYGASFHLSRGQGAWLGDRYEGRSDPDEIGQWTLKLKQNGSDGQFYSLLVDGQKKRLRFQRQAPPRFPPLPLAQQGVRFVGVFAGVQAIGTHAVGVSQLWLWESEGRYWSEYLERNGAAGERWDFLSTSVIHWRCEASCRGPLPRLLGKYEGRELRLQALDDGHWQLDHWPGTPPRRLTAGSLVDGFDLDLAPLGSAEQNQAWLHATTLGDTHRWQLPLSWPEAFVSPAQ